MSESLPLSLFLSLSCTNTYTYTYTCTHIHTHIHTCTHTHTHTHTYTHGHICLYEVFILISHCACAKSVAWRVSEPKHWSHHPYTHTHINTHSYARNRTCIHLTERRSHDVGSLESSWYHTSPQYLINRHCHVHESLHSLEQPALATHVEIEESRPCVLTYPPFLSLSTNLSVYDIANVHTLPRTHTHTPTHSRTLSETLFVCSLSRRQVQ